MNTGTALYIDPPSHHFLGDRLFDSSNAGFGGEDLLAPHRLVKEHFEARGIPVHTADYLEADTESERKVYVSLGRRDDAGRLAGLPGVVASAFFAMECPIVEPTMYRDLPAMARTFRRVFSWSDGESLLRFTGERVRCETFRWPQSFDAVVPGIWERADREFLAMINANKLPRVYWQELYTARLRAVEYFHRFGEIDLFGPNWDRMPNRVGKTWIPATARRLWARIWKVKQRLKPDPLYAAAAEATHGPVPSKLETLGGYTFALCFENMVLPGWITEKIFDCFFAGAVPVYWGAPDVERWIPADCFIDMRRFDDFEELRAHLHALGPDQIRAYREAARDFVASDRFDPFRKRAFLDLFRDVVREDTGLDV